MNKLIFVQFARENLPQELANYTVRLLARQQLMRRIHHRQKETTEFGMVMRIYNPLSQQEEENIDERFAEAVDMLEIVPANSHAIDRIILHVDSGYSSE